MSWFLWLHSIFCFFFSKNIQIAYLWIIISIHVLCVSTHDTRIGTTNDSIIFITPVTTICSNIEWKSELKIKGRRNVLLDHIQTISKWNIYNPSFPTLNENQNSKSKPKTNINKKHRKINMTKTKIHEKMFTAKPIINMGRNYKLWLAS